ncbi:MAG: hypothetical protein WBG86_22795, partial [Polyangiales bacterium]
AQACRALLVAESRHVRRLTADADGEELAAAKDATRSAFAAALEEGADTDCPTSSIDEGLVAGLDEISDDVVLRTVVSQGLGDSRYLKLTPGNTEYLGRTYTPQCVQ